MNCNLSAEIIGKLRLGPASGWLQRLVRRLRLLTSENPPTKQNDLRQEEPNKGVREEREKGQRPDVIAAGRIEGSSQERNPQHSIPLACVRDQITDKRGCDGEHNSHEPAPAIKVKSHRPRLSLL